MMSGLASKEDTVMKKYISLTVLLISLLAVGAFAQAEDDPVQEQTQVQTQLQTRENRQVPEGDKTLDGDKSGGQNQEMNYGGGEGETHERGEIPRHGGDFAGEGGPNGPLDPGDKVLDGEGDGECDGEQTRTRNYGEGEGNSQELGEMHRYGDENEGEGPHGSHGTEGSGPIDDFLKISGENADGAFAGEMMRYGWGPGDSTLDGPFGPNDGTGYGPGGRDAAEDGNSAKGARGQARGGRR